MTRIPFRIYDRRGHKVSGLLFLEEEFIVLEIQVLTLGIVKQSPETVKAEYALIDSIHFESGLFGDRIIIVPRKIEMIDAVPGAEKGEIRLKIHKRYRDEAMGVVHEVKRLMNLKRIAQQ